MTRFAMALVAAALAVTSTSAVQYSLSGRPTRRRMLTAIPLLVSAPVAAEESAAEDAALYDAGVRASGRGANALLKNRATTGVVRTGGVADPLFKPGQILDELKAADGSAASVSFAFPESWALAKGPNLDVRSVSTADSAFVLVAPLPASARGDVSTLPASFFTELLFAKDGKYGSYGGVESLVVTSDRTDVLKTPTGATQPYRRLAIKFSVLTYNQNTVERRSLLSATAVGGSVYLLSAGCIASRFKTVSEQLADCQQSFRALADRAARGPS